MPEMHRYKRSVQRNWFGRIWNLLHGAFEKRFFSKEILKKTGNLSGFIIFFFFFVFWKQNRSPYLCLFFLEKIGLGEFINIPSISLFI